MAFIKNPTKYDDLFPNDPEVEVALDVTPLSQTPHQKTLQSQPSNLPQKKGSRSNTNPPASSGSRSVKRLRPSYEGTPSISFPKKQKFFDMVGGQIPEEAVQEWDKYKLVEAAQERSLSNAKSLFLDMKFGERIVEAARGDRRVKE